MTGSLLGRELHTALVFPTIINQTHCKLLSGAFRTGSLSCPSAEQSRHVNRDRTKLYFGPNTIYKWTLNRFSIIIVPLYVEDGTTSGHFVGSSHFEITCSKQKSFTPAQKVQLQVTHSITRNCNSTACFWGQKNTLLKEINFQGPNRDEIISMPLDAHPLADALSSAKAT